MTRLATILILSCAVLSAASAAGAQAAAQQSAPAAPSSSPPAALDLRPKFAPGQSLRYRMELVTKTETSSSGVVQDPQGPSQLIVTWDATVRIDVLPPDAAPPANAAPQGQSPAPALRLRMTYEKSTATIQSDSYDPSAAGIQDQYQRLQGHAVEFALDAHGKITGVSGGDDVFETPQAARDAQAWVEQLSSGLGAPGTSAAPGQHWDSEEPAPGIPLPGMTWHTDSTYQRNEPCRESPPAAAGPPSSATAGGETCAVILTRVSLVPPKSQPKSESGANKKSAAPSAADPNSPGAIANGMQTTGTWTGSSESVIYVSLRTGWVVSVTQSGDEQMDVTMFTEHLDSIRYAGTIHSHIDLLLLP